MENSNQIRRTKMKMTPEQKAFYEYGRAVESVRATVKKIRHQAIREFGEPYFRLMQSERKCLISAMDLAGKIHTVRKKRAACRAWVPLIRRDCHNCTYQGITPVPDFCFPCINEGIPINWEPRKEGE